MKWLILVMFLAGCGSKGPEIDNLLRASVDRYLAHAPDSGKWDEVTSIVFDADLPPDTLGLCNKQKSNLTGLSTGRSILILPGQEGDLLDATVAHEAAHCLHDKVHDPDYFPPKLMNAEILQNPAYWHENLNDQIEELLKYN